MEIREAQTIIGGVFGLEVRPDGEIGAPFLQEDDILLVNARSGLHLLVQQLTPAHVWMPSYLCSALVAAVEGTDAHVMYYEVDYDLRVLSFEWLDVVGDGDLVVVIDYFGFPADSSLAQRAKERGAWVVEDACQALLTESVGSKADFLLLSPRKFMGVPDGGILSTRTPKQYTQRLNSITLQPAPREFWFAAFCSCLLRREFDLRAGNRNWFQLFQRSEASHPVGPYRMSDLTNVLLRYGFDYKGIAQRRRENYQCLCDKLREFAIFPQLPAEVVPLGFPVRHAERDRLRQALFEQQTYPSVHWDIHGFVPARFEESHRLARNIMTLPCDQRYDVGDMNRMARCLREEMHP